MEVNVFDLKAFRVNQLKISQEKFAAALGISQDKVSRMEAHPENISLEVILKIAAYFGISPSELFTLSKPTPKPLHVDYTFTGCQYIKDKISECISKNDVDTSYQDDIKTLNGLIERSYHKPRVAFVGCSDAGKSSMINALLGISKIPARWKPTTAITIYIKHIDDKPDFINENDDVWIFKSDSKTGLSWDSTRLFDETYCRSLKLCSGNFDLLESYGTHDGEYFKKKDGATSAVAFIKSDLLLNCDFIDFPGFGIGNRIEDEALWMNIKNIADIIVYLSNANDFMHDEDIRYLRRSLRSLPHIEYCNNTCDKMNLNPLSNLFVVASQAHIRQHEDINYVLNSGYRRFKNYGLAFFQTGHNLDSLSDRFYGYTTNDPALCTRFNEDLCSVIQDLPYSIEQKANTTIQNWTSNKINLLDNIIDVYTYFFNNKQNLLEYIGKDAQRERHISLQNERKNINDIISKYRDYCAREITEEYNNLINVEKLPIHIDGFGMKNNPQDIQNFSSHICNTLQQQVHSVLTKHYKTFFDLNVKKFTDVFQLNISILLFPQNVDITPISDDIQEFSNSLNSVCMSALKVFSKLADVPKTSSDPTFTIHPKENLDSSSKMAMSIFSIVAGGLIFTPVVYSLMSSSTSRGPEWKKSFSKKIVESLKAEGALDKLLEENNAFWTLVQESFSLSLSNLNDKFDHFLMSLKEIVNADVEDIPVITEAKKMNNMLKTIQNLL